MEVKAGNGTALEKTESPLITVGSRTISKHGWTIPAAEAHLHIHLGKEDDKWCDVGCMAKTMFLRNSDSNRLEVRRRVSRLRSMLLEKGQFLIVEYGDRGKIKCFKIFEINGDPSEGLMVQSQLARMLDRNEVTAERARQIQNLLDSSVRLPSEPE